MLKTLSAALLGVAIVAAPVLAATPAKNAQTPVKTTQAQVIKADKAKSKAMNANAKLHRDHVRQGKTSVLKKHKTSKVAIKPVAPAKPAKRG
jgi:hypothetical protein